MTMTGITLGRTSVRMIDRCPLPERRRRRRIRDGRSRASRRAHSGRRTGYLRERLHKARSSVRPEGGDDRERQQDVGKAISMSMRASSHCRCARGVTGDDTDGRSRSRRPMRVAAKPTAIETRVPPKQAAPECPGRADPCREDAPAVSTGFNRSAVPSHPGPEAGGPGPERSATGISPSSTSPPAASRLLSKGARR